MPGLNYIGDLYAKLGKRMYIKLEMTAADVDKLQKENKDLKAMCEKELSLTDIHKYAHKLFDSFKNLNFRITYNKALQAIYLEERLYVVRSHVMGKYQYTLVEADSEEQAIRKCI